VRPWHQRCELGKEVERIERQRVCAVKPRSFQLQRDASVGQLTEPVFRQRRASTVARELFEQQLSTGSIGGDSEPRMQIETLDVRLQLANAFLPLRTRVAAEAVQRRTRTRA